MTDIAGRVAMGVVSCLGLTAFLAICVVRRAPAVIVGSVIHCYPRTHPRRAELAAEYAYLLDDVTSASERTKWVCQQFATALVDGLPARVDAARRKLLVSRSGGESLGRFLGMISPVLSVSTIAYNVLSPILKPASQLMQLAASVGVGLIVAMMTELFGTLLSGRRRAERPCDFRLKGVRAELRVQLISILIIGAGILSLSASFSIVSWYFFSVPQALGISLVLLVSPVLQLLANRHIKRVHANQN
ncbi:hypothetical protein [Amycolatopsis lexingtonensis]|uniref:hypothetical protein n=1 Tax=Amycolatopsis lexingtonensis TaxID=218822 RepID=UPI003F71DF19